MDPASERLALILGGLILSMVMAAVSQDSRISPWLLLFDRGVIVVGLGFAVFGLAKLVRAWAVARIPRDTAGDKNKGAP